MASNNGIYSDYESDFDRTRFRVNNNTPVSILESGVVIYKGPKNNWENVIVIQGIDGVDYWYGNVINSDINLYDYLEKNHIIGESDGNYFDLVMKKGNNIIKYENYKV